MKKFKKLRLTLVVFMIAMLACASFVLAGCPDNGGDDPDAPHTHTYGAWEDVPGSEATCLNAGSERRVCTGCEAGTEGHEETRAKAALGHSYGEWADVPGDTADCENAGSEKRVCANCVAGTQGHEETRVKEALGHDWEEEIVTAPTYRNPGLQTNTCQNPDCGEEVNIDLEALGIPAEFHGVWTADLSTISLGLEIDAESITATGADAPYFVFIEADGHDGVIEFQMVLGVQPGTDIAIMSDATLTVNEAGKLVLSYEYEGTTLQNFFSKQGGTTPTPPPTPSEYTITVNVNNDAYGSYELSEAGPYEEGDTVTLTVEAEEGYEISRVTNNGMTITGVNGEYLITVGTENITIEITFTETAEVGELSISSEYRGNWISETEAYSVVVTEDSITINGDAATNIREPEDDPISGFNPGGYLFTWNGKECELIFTLGTGELFFIIEADDVWELLVDADAPVVETYEVTVEVNGEGGTAVLSENGPFAEGTEVTLTVTPDEGYVIEMVVANGDELTAEEDGTYIITVGTEDINVVVTFAEEETFPVNPIASGTGTQFDPYILTDIRGDFTVTLTASRGYYTKVYFSYTPAETKSYTAYSANHPDFTAWRFSSPSTIVWDLNANQTFNAGSTYLFTWNGNLSASKYSDQDFSLHFIIIEQGEDMSKVPVAETYDVTVNSDSEKGSYTLSANGPFESGYAVTLTVTANDGWEIDTVAANGSVLTADADKKYYIVIGTQDVTVDITFKEEYVAPPIIDDGGKIKAEHRGAWWGTASNDKVYTIFLLANDIYIYDEAAGTVVQATNLNVTDSVHWGISYTFKYNNRDCELYDYNAANKTFIFLMNSSGRTFEWVGEATEQDVEDLMNAGSGSGGGEGSTTEKDAFAGTWEGEKSSKSYVLEVAVTDAGLSAKLTRTSWGMAVSRDYNLTAQPDGSYAGPCITSGYTDDYMILNVNGEVITMEAWEATVELALTARPEPPAPSVNKDAFVGQWQNYDSSSKTYDVNVTATDDGLSVELIRTSVIAGSALPVTRNYNLTAQADGSFAGACITADHEDDYMTLTINGEALTMEAWDVTISLTKVEAAPSVNKDAFVGQWQNYDNSSKTYDVKVTATDEGLSVELIRTSVIAGSALPVTRNYNLTAQADGSFAGACITADHEDDYMVLTINGEALTMEAWDVTISLTKVEPDVRESFVGQWQNYDNSSKTYDVKVTMTDDGLSVELIRTSVIAGSALPVTRNYNLTAQADGSFAGACITADHEDDYMVLTINGEALTMEAWDVTIQLTKVEVQPEEPDAKDAFVGEWKGQKGTSKTFDVTITATENGLEVSVKRTQNAGGQNMAATRTYVLTEQADGSFTGDCNEASSSLTLNLESDGSILLYESGWGDELWLEKVGE